MYNFKWIQMKLMIFKSMSSNFLQYTMHLIGLNRVYHVVPFSTESMVRKKPMIRFAETISQGELSWSSTLAKTLCCVCRRFLPLFLSAKALGGPDAKAGVFPGPSKSARELPFGKGQTFSRSGKKFSKEKRNNDPRRERFVFPCFSFIVSAFSPEATGAFQADPCGPIRGP